MRIYVAGKTHDLWVIREVQVWLKEQGHTITHDWTQAVEQHGADHEGAPLSRENAERYAIEDINGVRSADAVIVIPHPRWCGSLIEIGAALITNTSVVVLGTPHQRCVFWAHPSIRMTRCEWPMVRTKLSGVLYSIQSRQAPFPNQRIPLEGRQ